MPVRPAVQPFARLCWLAPLRREIALSPGKKQTRDAEPRAFDSVKLFQPRVFHLRIAPRVLMIGKMTKPTRIWASTRARMGICLTGPVPAQHQLDLPSLPKYSRYRAILPSRMSQEIVTRLRYISPRNKPSSRNSKTTVCSLAVSRSNSTTCSPWL